MKWIIPAALLVALAACVRAGPSPTTKTCVPNESWREECNDCICSEEGRPMCTKRDCTASTTEASLPKKTCEPGTRWKQACNTCRCTSAGVGICTQMACLGALGGAAEDATQTPPGRPGLGALCREGHVWKEDCNTCRCVGGSAACTMMLCLPGMEQPSSTTAIPVPEGDQCTPGTTWKKDCNRCSCTSTGLAMCTMMKCLRRRDVPAAAPSDGVPHRGCTPGETWKDDCNRCRCTPDGLTACTKMRCIRPPQEQPAQQNQPNLE